MITVVFGVAPKPEIVGRLSLVVAPLLSVPVTGEISSVTVKDVMAAGAVVSTLTLKLADGRLTLPAASVAVTVKLCPPGTNGVVTWKFHCPVPLAVTVVSRIPLSYMDTFAPGSTVPLRTGWVSSVTPPLVRLPVIEPISSLTVIAPGIAGAMVSTVTLNTGELPLTLPAASVAVTDSVWLLLSSGSSGVNDHEPLASARVVPSSVVPS